MYQNVSGKSIENQELILRIFFAVNDVDDERSVRDALGSDDGESALGDDDGRSVRDDNRHCHACYHCHRHKPHRLCRHLCHRC